MLVYGSALKFSFQVSKNAKKFYVLNIRCKSFNSSNWLKRRDADPYIEKAKRENYRCRSAFKLIDIDNKYKLLKPGDKVIDIGAAPGSWSQVLAQRTNSAGKDKGSKIGLVIAIDLSYIFPIDGVHTLPKLDFTSESAQKQIEEILSKEQLDCVFSDMAPNATGIKSLDQEKIANLLISVLLFATKHLKFGGSCVVKIWEGQHKRIVDDMTKLFENVNLFKPKATYQSSAEIYIVGRQFVWNKNKSVL